MAGKSVLIIGPGFIGWNVLDLLVAEGYHVTGLVRREEHAEAIRKSRARAVLGDLHNADLIAQETTNADVRTTFPTPIFRFSSFSTLPPIFFFPGTSSPISKPKRPSPQTTPSNLPHRSSSTPPPPTISPPPPPS